ncbi:MAG TPA: MgtC/SapB family protein [Gemmatimonadaceae bacterium]
MTRELSDLPYAPTLARLSLALAIGLFVGIERERRRKEAGLRTFAFASLLGAAGGLLGEPYSLLALGLLGVLVVLLNIATIRTGEGAEITTSAALLVIGFAGVLAGQGHTFTPTLLGVGTAALLAWKEPLAGFSHTLSESELRSAVLLAILAFVVYPVLPTGTVDRWNLIDPRAAWVSVLLIAALGFVNYILLSLYGARGIEFTGFLGGLVNSTVTVTELATRVREGHGQLADAAYRGIVLATSAMLVRNGIILGLLAPDAFVSASGPYALMLAGAVAAALWDRRRRKAREVPTDDGEPGHASTPLTPPVMTSPFSLASALKFGLIFLALQIAVTLAARFLGETGVYALSVGGGVLSSASTVASAANLSTAGSLSARVAGHSAIIASVASAMVDLPLVSRFGRDARLTRRVALFIASIAALGAIGVVADLLLP